MTHTRRRFRSPAEQSYWDKLSQRERVVFTVAYACGKGAPFPTANMIRSIAVAVGAKKPPRPTQPRMGPPGRDCEQCGERWFPEPGKRGRPYSTCQTCRGVS